MAVPSPITPRDLFRIVSAQGDGRLVPQLRYPAVPPTLPGGSSRRLAHDAARTVKEELGLASQDAFYFGTGRQLAREVETMLACAVSATFWIEDSAAWKYSQPELRRALRSFYLTYPENPATFHAAPRWWTDKGVAKTFLDANVIDVVPPSFSVWRPLGEEYCLGFEHLPDPSDVRTRTPVWINTEGLRWLEPQGLSPRDACIAHVHQCRAVPGRGGETHRQVISVAGGTSDYTSLLAQGIHPALEGKIRPLYVDASGYLHLKPAAGSTLLDEEGIFDFHHLAAQRLYMNRRGFVYCDRLEFPIQPGSGVFSSIAMEWSKFRSLEGSTFEFTPLGVWATRQRWH